jgi:hypothetical protein
VLGALATLLWESSSSKPRGQTVPTSLSIDWSAGIKSAIFPINDEMVMEYFGVKLLDLFKPLVDTPYLNATLQLTKYTGKHALDVFNLVSRDV